MATALCQKQRLPLLFYGVSLGGMNYLFIFLFRRYRWVLRWRWSSPDHGGGTVLFSSPGRFRLGCAGVLGLWFLLPLGQDVSHVDLTAVRWHWGPGLVGLFTF